MALAAFDNQQIPTPSTSLLGRATEFARLTDMLQRPEVRLVTLTGPGGVGKTRLALHVAHEWDRSINGDVHFVMLANATDAGAVLTAIARAIGITQGGAVAMETQIADAIGHRSLLLILDNVEQVAAHLTFLSTLVGVCPGLTVLVTSRTMLNLSAEHVFSVDPLPTVSHDDQVAPATALFIERAQAVSPDLALTSENIAAIDEMCRQLDGLPLAIELAAARTRFLPPTSLRDRLGERLHLLVGGPRDAPERHRTLRATLTWSHDLLSSDERVLFRRLAVFENGGPFEAIEPVCNATGDLAGDVEEILAALVDHSLVRIVDMPATGPRVRLLNTIREFAHEHLTMSGEMDAVGAAHATWYSNLVVQAPPETWRTGTAELRDWTLRHLPDLDNFQVMLEWLVEQEAFGTAVGVVGSFSPFWMELGHFRGGWAWMKRLLSVAGEASPEAQARFYYMAGGMALANDEPAEGIEYAQRALDLSQRLGLQRLVANCQNLVGALHWRLGNPAEGERYQLAAIDTIQKPPDPLAGSMFASQLAGHLIENGEFDRAEALLVEALPIIERERPLGLPLFQGTMAYLAMHRDDLERAGRYVDLALDYHREPPHRQPLSLAGLLVIAAELAVRRSAPESGTRLLGAAEAIFKRVGYTMRPEDRSDYDQVAVKVRSALTNDQYAAETARGRALTIPDAIDLASTVARMRITDDEAAPGPDDDLTPREREVLALLAEGKSNGAIAEALFISQRTVTTHLSRLYAKLDVSTRSEAIAHAVRMGLVSSRSGST